MSQRDATKANAHVEEDRSGQASFRRVDHARGKAKSASMSPIFCSPKAGQTRRRERWPLTATDLGRRHREELSAQRRVGF